MEKAGGLFVRRTCIALGFISRPSLRLTSPAKHLRHRLITSPTASRSPRGLKQPPSGCPLNMSVLRISGWPTVVISFPRRILGAWLQGRTAVYRASTLQFFLVIRPWTPQSPRHSTRATLSATLEGPIPPALARDRVPGFSEQNRGHAARVARSARCSICSRRRSSRSLPGACEQKLRRRRSSLARTGHLRHTPRRRSRTPRRAKPDRRETYAQA